MALWTISHLLKVIATPEIIPPDAMQHFLAYMNTHFPMKRVEEHRQKRRAALGAMDLMRKRVLDSRQQFPPLITHEQLTSSAASLQGFGIVFTAGGEGERLRLTLLKSGISESALRNFTKATFELPGFFRNFGTLQTNLAMVAHFCKSTGITIPVVITTGPANSTTARIIPEMLRTYHNFGLEQIRIIPQDERIHFTNDEKIAVTTQNGQLRPVTHPDETGGPLMKLKQPLDVLGGQSALSWFASINCQKTIVVQATALYNQTLLPLMAAALGNHDCLGVGILRGSFPLNDPYGTFVTLDNATRQTTCIIEQDIRNDQTRILTDSTQTYYLPFNTGFYAFNNILLAERNLPDFATPPKEILPQLERAPKIGYAATDLLTIAEKPLILSIAPSMFGVLKTAGDLQNLALLGKQFGLDRLCSNAIE